MVWEHSEKTHSNWRETILRALEGGHITTVITFNDTKYLVTLKPVESTDRKFFNKQKPFQRSRCVICHQNIVWIVGSQFWKHALKGEYDHSAHFDHNVYPIGSDI